MNDNGPDLESDALAFIKADPRLVISTFAGQSISVATPVSLFMAGSPGAGKTEVSRGLMKRFITVPVRIDADEIRALCPGYTGVNAHLFQKAATKGVNILYDYVLKHRLHTILDGTFAYGNALMNIERSITKGRTTELWFIYQDPVKAWEFTKAREATECRHVSKETFIKAFLAAKQNTQEAKNAFGSQLTLNVIIKNIDNSDGTLHLNIQADELDRYVRPAYTQEELNSLLL